MGVALMDWWKGSPVKHLWAWKNGQAPPGPAAMGPVDWEPLLREPYSEVGPELQAKIKLGTDYQPRRWLKTYYTHGLTRDALVRMLDRCRDQHIKVILLSAPVAQYHREMYRPEVENQFQTCMQELQEQYDLVYVDARDWLADGLFVDNHHLSSVGSEYYSRLLARRVLCPVLCNSLGRSYVSGWIQGHR